MNNEIRLQIINLLKFIFEDGDYTKAAYYLHNNQLNNLRLLVDEKYELLDITQHLDPDNEVIKAQLTQCDLLEDVVMDAYLELR